jgi:hypothetical protein
MLDSNHLINAFDDYGDLIADRYFTIKYDHVATTAEIEIQLKPQKEIMKLVLDELSINDWNIEVVYKEWNIAKQSDVKAGDDYVKYVFFSSDSASICMDVQTYPEYASVEFYYDQKEVGLEEWVFAQINKLRAKFGKPVNPVFRVLTKGRDGYRTRVVDIDHANIDLKVNYNDSLLEVDGIIRNSIEEQQSGLILLHGIPGTGKTSYIKTLLTRYMDEKFIFIPNDFVDEMLKPDFITFLITQKNSILVIEDAESVIMARDQSQNKSIVSTILQITDGLFSDYLNIKVICTFNTDVSKIDKALFRKGRMIAFYKFEELEVKKAMTLLDVKNTNELPEARTLAELYNHKERSFTDAATKKAIGFNR